MKFGTFAALAVAATLAACGGDDKPTQLWEATGFEQPESALPDTAAGIIYVSNVVGSPADKDGNGYISKLTMDGKVTAQKWVTGLDSPKGLGLLEGKLYVADLAQLVEIDVATGQIAARHAAPGGKILNDVTIGSDGSVYASDWPGNAIWRLSGGTFEKWLETDQLKNPNGLLFEGDKLVVAAWGKMEPDFSTKTPGNLLAVKLADKSVSDLGDGKPVGNLDGIEPFDADSYIVSDWVAGKVFQITHGGAVTELLSLGQGTADLGFVPGTRTAIIPLMVAGKVVAYKF